MTTYYSHETQRIRLPSVNDIFPHNHPEHSKHPIIISPMPISPIHHPETIMIPLHQQQQQQQQPQQQAYINQLQPGFIPDHPNAMVHYPMTPIGHSGSPVYSTPRQYYTNSPSPSATLYANANMNRYKISKQTTRQSNAWSYEDDCLLKYLKEVKNLGWREISMYFKNRTANGCQFRWRRIAAVAKMSNESEEMASPPSTISSENTSEASSPRTSSIKSNCLQSILN